MSNSNSNSSSVSSSYSSGLCVRRVTRQHEGHASTTMSQDLTTSSFVGVGSSGTVIARRSSRLQQKRNVGKDATMDREMTGTAAAAAAATGSVPPPAVSITSLDDTKQQTHHHHHHHQQQHRHLPTTNRLTSNNNTDSISSPPPSYFLRSGQRGIDHSNTTIQRTQSLDEQVLSSSSSSSEKGRKGGGRRRDDVGGIGIGNGLGRGRQMDFGMDGSQPQHIQSTEPRFLFGEHFVDEEYMHDDDNDDNDDDVMNKNGEYDVIQDVNRYSSVSMALHSSFDESLLRHGDQRLRLENNIGLGRNMTGKEQCLNHQRNNNEISGRKHHLRPRTPVESNSEAEIKQPPRTVRKKQPREDYMREFDSVMDNQVQSHAYTGSNGRRLTTQTPGRVRPRRLSTTPNPTHGVATAQQQTSATKRRQAPTSYRPRQSPMRRAPPNTPVSPFVAARNSGSNHQLLQSQHHLSTALSAATEARGRPESHSGAQTLNFKSTGQVQDSSWKHNSVPWTSESQQQASGGFTRAPLPTKTPIKSFTDKHEGGTALTGPTQFASHQQLETTFDTTDDTNSVDTTSPARFRFSSFPASLPRVNNLRNSIRQDRNHKKDDTTYPDSVRKHMTFAELVESKNESADEDDCAEWDNSIVARSKSKSIDPNQSRDDDGTLNTSISSWSADGGGGGHHRHLPEVPGQTYSSSSNLFRSMDVSASGRVFNTLGRAQNPFSSQRNTTKLHNDSGGDLNHSAIDKTSVCDTAGRTTKHPMDMNIELFKPYDNQKRINSFQSSLSSNTQMNISDDVPSLSPSGRSGLLGHFDNGTEPDTPREVQLLFPSEAECSPILDVKDRDNAKVQPSDRDFAGVRGRDKNEESSTVSSALVGDRLLIPAQFSSTSSSSSAGIPPSSRRGAKAASSKQDAGSMASNSSHQRSIRPMPDMSGFETVAPNSRDRSRDESTIDSRGAGSVQRLMCPPTPQRTPAWQGGKHPFFASRSNSLVATKVLLAAPSQVLKGRSSLESSVLDYDESNTNTEKYLTIKEEEVPPPRTVMKLRSRSRTSELPEEDTNMDIDHDEEKKQHCSDLRIQDTNIDSTKAFNSGTDEITGPPSLTRRLPSPLSHDLPGGSSISSFSADFEILGLLGSGTFADVYKVRAKDDNKLYAVKRNRRQFRGKRDRDMAMAEAQSMQRLQSALALGDVMAKETSYSLYLLFFYKAWQEEGYFYSQTELCCRDTCRELLDSLRLTWNISKSQYPSLGRNANLTSSEAFTGGIVPTHTVWKILHDVSAGLSHIHANKIVHQDIKPSNVFFVYNTRFGAMCKIGDFGLAGDEGSSADGLEGDTRYMSPELLATSTRDPTSDIFSLGLSIYEVASEFHVDMPSEGPHWHQLRSTNEPKLSSGRGKELEILVQSMTNPKQTTRPTADQILQHPCVKSAGRRIDTFLRDYINDVEEFDRKRAELDALDYSEEKTPRHSQRLHAGVRSPTLLLPAAPFLSSPPATAKH